MNDPWRIERVHLDMTRGQVDVSVGHAKGARFPCPEYGQELAVYEHSAEQPWRRQLMTYLHASLPRIACPEHGVDQVRKEEHKALTVQGDNTLAWSKYLWLDNAGNIPDAARDRLDQIKREI